MDCARDLGCGKDLAVTGANPGSWAIGTGLNLEHVAHTGYQCVRLAE